MVFCRTVYEVYIILGMSRRWRVAETGVEFIENILPKHSTSDLLGFSIRGYQRLTFMDEFQQEIIQSNILNEIGEMLDLEFLKHELCKVTCLPSFIGNTGHCNSSPTTQVDEW
jgi:hypothetical protein